MIKLEQKDTKDSNRFLVFSLFVFYFIASYVVNVMLCVAFFSNILSAIPMCIMNKHRKRKEDSK